MSEIEREQLRLWSYLLRQVEPKGIWDEERIKHVADGLERWAGKPKPARGWAMYDLEKGRQ